MAKVVVVDLFVGPQAHSMARMPASSAGQGGEANVTPDRGLERERAATAMIA
jgi:hypothetical protein